MFSVRHGVFFAITAISSALASTACPVGYSNVFGDKCYKMTHVQNTWDDANAFCLNDDADLVSIHSQEENDAIQAALPGSGSYWIGLQCSRRDELTWTDGTPVDYTHNSGVTTTTTPAPLPGVGSECGLGYQLLEDTGICVRISDKLITWREAEAECQLEGAHLASIHSKQTNDYIRRLALSQRLINAIFIGIQMDSQTNAVSWSDASDVDFSNFDPGMPNAFFGECGAMQTVNIGGEWTSVSCGDYNKLPFACTKPQPCPATNIFTGSGNFSSPEYPSSRSSGLSCEYFIAASPGYLVLLSFDEFQLVDGDQVVLYEGMGTREPMEVITNATPTESFMTDSQSVMRLVHLTGSGSGIRKWHANFVSV